MRDLDHARGLIEAVVGAVQVPVTLKMRLRLGRMQPERARARTPRRSRRRAAHHGACPHALPVLQGQRRLGFVRRVKDAVAHSRRHQRRHRRSRQRAGGAGGLRRRRRHGRPRRLWRALDAGAHRGHAGDRPRSRIAAAVDARARSPRAHVEAMLAHHGTQHGLRNARKHIGWYLAGERHAHPTTVKAWRRRLCTSESAREVLGGLARLLRRKPQEMAA